MRGNKLMRWVDSHVGPPLLSTLRLFHSHHALPSAPPRRIGILACTAIGDLLIALSGMIPALRSQFPQARMTVFHTDFNQNVFDILPPIDALVPIALSNPVKAAAAIRREKLDLLIDLSQWARITAILSVSSATQCTIGFQTPGQRRHQGYDVTVPHHGDRHELENYAALLQPLGILHLQAPILRLPEAEIGPVQARILGGLVNSPYLVFHAWASGIHKHLKQWPASHWRALAERFIALGYAIVFTGAPSDAPATEALLRELPAASQTRAINAAGKLSLRETALLIQGAAGLVSVNTGIMHIGAALGAPLVALHGPTNPLRWGPLSNNADILLPDGPDVAYLNLGWEYPPKAQATLARITVDTVFEKARARIERR